MNLQDSGGSYILKKELDMFLLTITNALATAKSIDA